MCPSKCRDLWQEKNETSAKFRVESVNKMKKTLPTEAKASFYSLSLPFSKP